MKNNLISLATAAILILSCISVSAQNPNTEGAAFADAQLQSDAEEPKALTSSTLTVYLDTMYRALPIPADCTFTLTDPEQGKSYTASARIGERPAVSETGQSTPSEIVLSFTVPEFSSGKTFKLYADGVSGLKYYDTVYAPDFGIDLESYTYLNENSEPVLNSTFHLSADPLHKRELDLFVDYQKLSNLTEPAQMIDGIAMVPILETAAAVGVTDGKYYPEYNSISLRVGDKELLLNLNTTYATLNGQTIELPAAPTFYYSTILAPARTFADIFGCELVFQDEGDHYNLNFGRSSVAKEYYDSIGKAYVVNQRGIASDTNYLIWVNKPEYTLRVYQGSKGNWQFVNSFLVGIGKDSTPTCTGQYRYYSRESRWSYANYYVGPIMRFNGGYAIHSTLLRYNGIPYDNRVGIKLSHGCVRVQPQNLNWLVNTIPLYTKIYITD